MDFYCYNLSKKFNLFIYFSLRITTPNDGDVLLDYSKNRVNEKTLGLLFNLVRKHNFVTNIIDFLNYLHFCFYFVD